MTDWSLRRMFTTSIHRWRLLYRIYSSRRNYPSRFHLCMSQNNGKGDVGG
jgi:hypothetical protein